jgi:hypothetical protein
VIGFRKSGPQSEPRLADSSSSDLLQIPICDMGTRLTLQSMRLDWADDNAVDFEANHTINVNLNDRAWRATARWRLLGFGV